MTGAEVGAQLLQLRLEFALWRDWVGEFG